MSERLSEYSLNNQYIMSVITKLIIVYILIINNYLCIYLNSG